jgi:hypothetical protein
VTCKGNHDITLDEPFYNQIGKDKFKWPEPQNTAACRKLLTKNETITYLEHTSATIYLTLRTGPQTCFKVFGSPYSPGQRGWAFQYAQADEAEKLWEKIENDADIVITHTPARGHVDTATTDDRAGCEVLKRRLGVVRPGLSVCGHIHEGRGVKRVMWKSPLQTIISTQPVSHSLSDDNFVASVEYWKDSGAGNKKLSLVDLTGKAGRRLENAGCLTRHSVPESLRDMFGGQPDACAGLGSEGRQPDVGKVNSTSSLGDVALDCSGNEARVWRKKDGGAVEWRGRSDVGLEDLGRKVDMAAVRGARKETVTINAAFLGPRIAGKAMEFNKPIVVDIELPVWEFGR